MRAIVLFLVVLMAMASIAIAEPNSWKDMPKMMQADGKQTCHQDGCMGSGDKWKDDCVCEICHDKCFDNCAVFEFCDKCNKFHYCDGYCDSCGKECNWGEYCTACGYNHAGNVDGYCDKCGKRCNAYEQCDKCGHSRLYDGCCDECRIKCYYDVCCFQFCDQRCDTFPCECQAPRPEWNSDMKDGAMKDRAVKKELKAPRDGNFEIWIDMEKPGRMQRTAPISGQAESAPA